MTRGKYGKKKGKYSKKSKQFKKYSKSYSKPDGSHRAKIVQRIALNVNNNPGIADCANYTIAWQIPRDDMNAGGFFQGGVNCSFDWNTVQSNP